MTDIKLKEQLILDLHTIGAIKFGEFKLKSGIMSPYYLDLRLLVSFPYLLELTADVFWESLRTLFFDVLVGVPYAAIPIATAVAIKHNQTAVFVRKERKEYGTKKLVEGQFHKGQKALLIDDVITNADSKMETIKPLIEEGLIVEDVVVLLDRGQGGPELLEKAGYHCHCILSMNEVFNTLLQYKRINKDMVIKCKKFMKQSKQQFLKKK
ncbi:MAG: orotate phosphoribosyltransferase [Patescibacteria group bacterium]|nr:orotate phosphoribosyltransferase [Patescibacteria group bacterium]